VITMTLALGTSRPTSTTVLAARTRILPAAKSLITACWSFVGICPWISPTAYSGKARRLSCS